MGDGMVEVVVGNEATDEGVEEVGVGVLDLGEEELGVIIINLIIMGGGESEGVT